MIGNAVNRNMLFRGINQHVFLFHNTRINELEHNWIKLIRFFFSMGHNMALHIVNISKSPRTHWKGIWYFTSMSQHMFHHSVSISIWFGTQKRGFSTNINQLIPLYPINIPEWNMMNKILFFYRYVASYW